MERNQFYYTRKEPLPMLEGETETKYNLFKDSFNVDLVIRTILLEDGRRLVVLNDVHERIQDSPVHNKQGKVTAYKKDRYTFQSEIFLEKEDAQRFVDLTSVLI